MNQGGSEHPYQRLLTKFRQAHARHYKSPFVIELLSVKTLEYERKLHPNDFMYIGKFLFTDQFDSMRVSPPVVCATNVSSSPAFEDMPPRAFYDLAKQAWADFELLASEAGAHLPRVITDTLLDYTDEPDDPLSKWFALLYAKHSMHDEDLAEALRDRKILLRSPFQASADVIERCKLDTIDLISLSSMKQDILRALAEKNAVDSDHRETCEDITFAVAGTEGDPSAFKGPLAERVHDGFLDSRTGRGGGSWLTQAGIDRAGKQ